MSRISTFLLCNLLLKQLGRATEKLERKIDNCLEQYNAEVGGPNDERRKRRLLMSMAISVFLYGALVYLGIVNIPYKKVEMEKI